MDFELIKVKAHAVARLAGIQIRLDECNKRLKEASNAIEIHEALVQLMDITDPEVCFKVFQELRDKAVHSF